MKAIKFLGMLFAAFALSFATTSCGGDDDDDLDDLEQKIENGQIKTTVSISESKDQIVLTAKAEKVSTQTYTAKFQNNVCTSCTLTAEFSSGKLADEFEKEMKGEMELKRNGNKFTGDMTEEFQGMSYDEVKFAFQMIKAQLERSASASH